MYAFEVVNSVVLAKSIQSNAKNRVKLDGYKFQK
jgi:hypothetical protein